MIPTAFLISVIVFLLMRLVPGDVIDVMIAQLSESAEQIELDREQLEQKLGLDAPLIVQYARFLGIAPQVDGNVSGVLQGDFGVSWRQRLSVTELLFKKMPVTVELGLMGLVIAQLIAIPIGCIRPCGRTPGATTSAAASPSCRSRCPVSGWRRW